MNQQELYDKACNFLRTNGNPYGDLGSRGWGWVNPKNCAERCAIASFIAGKNDFEVRDNLLKLFNLPANACIIESIPVIQDIVMFFDHSPAYCNDPITLEIQLQEFALRNKLQYKTPITKKVRETKEVKKDLDTVE